MQTLNDYLQIKTTGDGSHSIYNQTLDEHYHSTQGAVAESMHVFIENGLKLISKKKINILEVGFGTGLNALLTYQYSARNSLDINYIGIEKYLLSETFVSKLNYSSLLPVDNNVFLQLHKNQISKPDISPFFHLKKINTDINNVDFRTLPYIDLVYYDAFSPSKQPELWTENIFKKIYDKMNTGGLLTTYSSAGIVKKSLRNVGFTVKRKPGAHGKFHMINALKDNF